MTATPFAWCDIEVPDLERAQEFYGTVFGWDFTPFGDDALLAYQDSEIAGRGLRGYLVTDDLEGMLARIEAAGGTVAKSRSEIGGDLGWWAWFRDPSGVTLGLCTDQPAA